MTRHWIQTGTALVLLAASFFGIAVGQTVSTVAIPGGGRAVTAKCDAAGTIHVLCEAHGGPQYVRSTDGGKSFELIGRGLPQEHAYDLVYRHALAVDASGSRLAMGSTTGGVWVSENGGESWQTVPARLPPVYAVRFA